MTSKRNTGIKMKDVEGYIHDVSNIKTPMSGNKYFDFTIQKHVDTRHVVSFSPDKRESVMEKEKSRSPIQILSASPQRKYQPDTVEYKMSGKSRVINTKSVPFLWAEASFHYLYNFVQQGR